jgi:hypothetical protein
LGPTLTEAESQKTALLTIKYFCCNAAKPNGQQQKEREPKKNQKRFIILFRTGSKTGPKMVPKLEPNLVQNRNLPQDFCCVNETRQKHDPKNGVTIVKKNDQSVTKNCSTTGGWHLFPLGEFDD